MTDHKLPDPPAYDPRVEHADQEDFVIAERAERVLDMAAEGNPIVCVIVVNRLLHTKNGKAALETACEELAGKLPITWMHELFPQAVLNELGIE